MRMRTVLAAVALAAATIIGGAATAAADDGPGNLPSIKKMCDDAVDPILNQGCLS
ncbi:hypothetical protein [Streptomyces sp. NPDC020607]|uniref:hypothetical protein n=1 Tax=Streptomyces sp. NPDC020607 TaxID=3365082 RepID=UPI003793CB27